MYVCVYMYMCLCVYVCMCVYMCVYVCVCVYMCVCVYVHDSLGIVLDKLWIHDHLQRWTEGGGSNERHDNGRRSWG